MFRFTIREALLLTLIVGMGAAWWLDRSEIETRRENTARRAAKLEAALQDSLRMEKGYEYAFREIRHSKYWKGGRLPMVIALPAELPAELRDDDE